MEKYRIYLLQLKKDYIFPFLKFFTAIINVLPLLWQEILSKKFNLFSSFLRQYNSDPILSFLPDIVVNPTTKLIKVVIVAVH